jgi:hypothetical protein
MLAKLFGMVWSELDEVRRASEMIHHFPNADKHKVHSLLELPPLETHFRPAVVLLVGRLFNCFQERMVVLAAMVQFVFLGMRVHGQVDEGELGPDERNRLAVLIGDYYYCRFFALGASAGMTGFLRPLTEIVYRYTEKTVSRAPAAATPETVRESVRRETAALIAEACRMAGEVAGAQDDEREILYQLGVDLGMGYGLMERGMRSEGWRYLQAARGQLAELPAGTARNALDGLIAYLLNWPGQSVVEVQG